MVVQLVKFAYVALIICQLKVVCEARPGHPSDQVLLHQLAGLNLGKNLMLYFQLFLKKIHEYGKPISQDQKIKLLKALANKIENVRMSTALPDYWRLRQG